MAEQMLSAADAMAGGLLDCLVRSGVVLGAALVVVLALRRRSAAVRHAILAVSLAAILALPVLRAGMPSWTVRLPAARRMESTGTSVPPTRDTEGIGAFGPARESPRADSLPSPTVRASERHAAAPRGIPGGSPVLTLTWQAGIALIWASGCAFMVLRLGVAGWRLRVLARRAHRITAHEALGGESAALLERSGARLLEADTADGQMSPVTWGWLRPAVLLPSGWRDWPADNIRSALLHELAHVRRRDWAVHMLAQAARALYWPNPLVWMAVSRLRQESEMACDDMALEAGIKSSDYAAHLLSIARQSARPANRAGLALSMARSARIERRIRSVLAPCQPRSAAGKRTWASVSALALAVLLPVACLRFGEAVASAYDSPPLSAPIASAQPLDPGLSPAAPSTGAPATIAAPAAEGRTALPNAAPPGQPAQPVTAWGEPVHGLQAGIRIAHGGPTVRIGDRAVFSLVLRNQTVHDIEVAFANVQRIFGWRVKKESDGRYVIAPRSRYPDEEKTEKLVAGAMSLTIGPGRETEVPMDRPSFPVTSGESDRGHTVLAGKPGSRLRIQALPLDYIARGDEWVEKLQTGVLTLTIADSPKSTLPTQVRSAAAIAWGPAMDGVQAGIRLEKEGRTYTVGEPIWHDVYVRNGGSRPISFVHQVGFEEQGRAEVKDAHGRAVHVQHYYGMGGMMLSGPKVAHPGEIVMVGRHSLAFTGAAMDPTEKEPAPGISTSAEGLPRAYAGPGKYALSQIAAGTVEGRPLELPTASVEIGITPNARADGARPMFISVPGRPFMDLATATVAWGKPVRGLQAGLLFLDGKREYVAGEQVRVAIVVRNVSAEPITFWHEVSFGALPPPEIRGSHGRSVAARLVPETEWRPLGELRMTGVTFDMTSAPSAGGPSRLRQSEIRPGQAVIGYSLSTFLAPPGAGEQEYTVRQALPLGFSAKADTEARVTTGSLSFRAFPADAAGF